MLRLAALMLCLAGPAPADPVILDASASAVRATSDGIAVTIALSRPAPWRVTLLDAPPQLVVEIAGLADGPVPDGMAREPVAPGFGRIVVPLGAPAPVTRAGMLTRDGSTRIEIGLGPAGRAADPPAAASASPPVTPKPVTVVLDPGHGGLDPGATRDGVTEAHLMLTFARELRTRLRAAGFAVVLTREADVYVPLQTRVSLARAAGADVMLSLHADALAEGRASGATVFTLSARASDRASARLAESHDRDDLLAGVDLDGQDDEIASVLMDMARTDTAPRSDRLADALVAGIAGVTGGRRKHPRLGASFSVLKAPDFPSALVEIGFLSSPADRADLVDPAWRARMTDGITAGIVAWAAEDRVARARR